MTEDFLHTAFQAFSNHQYAVGYKYLKAAKTDKEIEAAFRRKRHAEGMALLSKALSSAAKADVAYKPKFESKTKEKD